MKGLQKPKYIPHIVCAAGLIGLLLRVLLYVFGPDDRGLISKSHPLHIACWVLAAATAVFAALSARKLGSSNAYEDNFPANKNRVVITVLAPVWFLVSAFSAWELAADTVGLVWVVFSFAAVPCLAYTGYCQITGKKPLFIFHGIVCIFFALDMVCRYRIWSGNPQLPDYSFRLLACAFLTLSAYHRMAFDVDLGRRRMFLLCSLMAVFFCTVSVIGPGNQAFYLGGALWALSTLCPMKLRRKPKPEIPEEP